MQKLRKPKLILRRHPRCEWATGDVSLVSPDGSYFYEEGARVQVIVVGPMMFTPAEYQCAVNQVTNDGGYEIESAEFLPGGDARGTKWALQRGVVSMVFACTKHRPIAVEPLAGKLTPEMEVTGLARDEPGVKAEEAKCQTRTNSSRTKTRNSARTHSSSRAKRKIPRSRSRAKASPAGVDAGKARK